MAEEIKKGAAPFSNVEMVKLDGTIIKTDGSQYKSNFFKFLELNPDDYSDIVYTPKQAQKIRAHLLHLSTGSSASVPMVCGGEARCPIAKAGRCVFVNEDKANKKINPTAKSIIPVGRMCPVEYNLLNEYTRFYCQEYDVQENSFTEIQMCRELAEIEMLLHRINTSLAIAENATMLQDDVVAIDKGSGEPLTRRAPSSLFEIKERLQGRKSRLTKLMVGDRQEKYKREAALKQRDESDASQQTAQLRGKLNQLLESAKKVDLQIKEAEGDVIDVEVSGAVSPDDMIAGMTIPEDSDE